MKFLNIEESYELDSKGFTLMEILIASLVGGVVITLIYSLLHIGNITSLKSTLFSSYKREAIDTIELLKKDLRGGKTILTEPDSEDVPLIVYDCDGNRIEYRLEDEKLFRNSNLVAENVLYFSVLRNAGPGGEIEISMNFNKYSPHSTVHENLMIKILNYNRLGTISN